MLKRDLERELAVMELAVLYSLRIAEAEYDTGRLEELEEELLKADKPQLQLPEGTATP